MDAVIEFQLQQMEELKALLVEQKLLRMAANDAAFALARSNEKVELYLREMPQVR